MAKIALIGVGSMGRRHLEALCSRSESSIFYIVDTDASCLEASRIVVYEHCKNKDHEFYYYQELQLLPKDIDLAIVATSSAMRYEIIRIILSRSSVRNFLLEKFLFPKEDEYEEAARLFREHGSKVWVNCGRRHYVFYNDLKNSLAHEKIQRMSVHGTDWNLASNSIHFIDLLGFLVDSSAYDIFQTRLGNVPLASKRPGYLDFSGALWGEFENGTVFSLMNNPGSDRYFVLELVTDKQLLLIDEARGICYRYQLTSGNLSQDAFILPYQSQLTGKMADDILLRNRCNLTKFESSARLHLPLLRVFIKHAQDKLGRDDQCCPIT